MSRTTAKIQKRKTERGPSHAIVRGPTQRVDAIRLSDSGPPRNSGVVFRQRPDTDCRHLPLMFRVSLRYYVRTLWNQICQQTLKEGSLRRA